MDLYLLLVVMSLATYRLTRLVTKDTFPPVLWVRDQLAGGWREATQAEVDKGAELQMIEGEPHVYVQRVRWSPQWLADLISCPWCSSGWVSMGVVGACATFSSVPELLVVWPAVWAAGALIASQDWA